MHKASSGNLNCYRQSRREGLTAAQHLLLLPSMAGKDAFDVRRDKPPFDQSAAGNGIIHVVDRLCFAFV
jgi:hypothetical protein